MQTDLFVHEVTQTSAVFGRKSEIRVVFQGEGAFTDNESMVNLPALPMGVEIDERSQKIIRGYADHESGHLRHTDKEVLVKNEKLMKANPKLHQVWNALEDVWLERRVIEEYPGAMENIRETATAVDGAALNRFKAGDDVWMDDKFIGPAAITWEGRKDYGHDTGKQCLERVSETVRENVKAWVEALDACKTTADVMELAKWAHGKLQEGLEREPEPWPGPGKKGKKKEGEGEGTGTKGEASKEEKGKGEKAEAEASKGDDEGDGETGGERRKEQGGHEAGTGSKGGRDDHEYMEFDLTRAVEQTVGELKKAGGRSAYRPYSTKDDKVHTRFDAPDKYAPSQSYGNQMRRLARDVPDKYQTRLGEVSGNINVVRRKLERSLMAQMNRSWTGGHVAGRMDPKRLVSAYRGEQNVYKMRDPAPELDTAVEILVDLSGSMRGYKAELAANVCVVLAEVLSKAGVAFEITGFNNRSVAVVTDPKSGAKGTVYGVDLCGMHPGFDRYEPVDVYVFKAFDERFAEAKVYIAHLNQFADGNNSDSDALLMVAPRLEARLERKKVFMVLSDGHPSFIGSEGKGERHLVQVVKDMKARGIECVGIGISDANVSRFYPRHVVVNDLSDLGKHAVDQLAKVLLGERYIVDPASLMKGSAA